MRARLPLRRGRAIDAGPLHAAARVGGAGGGEGAILRSAPAGPEGPAGRAPPPSFRPGSRTAHRTRVSEPRQRTARAKKKKRRRRRLALRRPWPPGKSACLSRRMRPSPPLGGALRCPSSGGLPGDRRPPFPRPAFCRRPPMPTSRPARLESDFFLRHGGPRAAFAQAVRAGRRRPSRSARRRMLRSRRLARLKAAWGGSH